jgi:hypothetical protein
MVVPAALADCNGRAPAIAQVAMAAAELATTHRYWTATAVGVLDRQPTKGSTRSR